MGRMLYQVTSAIKDFVGRDKLTPDSRHIAVLNLPPPNPSLPTLRKSVQRLGNCVVRSRGGQVTFNFYVTAPSTGGTYISSRNARKNGGEWDPTVATAVIAMELGESVCNSDCRSMAI